VRLPRRQFEQLVDESLEEIPPEFEKHLEGIAIDIEDEPDERTLTELGIGSRRSLLGLYHGRPLTGRTNAHSAAWPDTIVIYQRNIERLCRSRADIRRQVRKTVLHEVGHHFGLSENDLDRLGYR